MVKKNSSTKPELTEAQKMQVKRDSFSRVVVPRVDKAIKSIRLVGDCTSINYIYTDVQAAVIVEMLQAAVDDVKSRFAGESGKSGGFVLPE